MTFSSPVARGYSLLILMLTFLKYQKSREKIEHTVGKIFIDNRLQIELSQ